MPPLANLTEPARLAIQARAWAEAAAELIDRIGVGPGWSCADLGCGPAGILGLLARRVGRNGTVVGVDRDVAALVAALTACRRMPNVSLRPGEVTRTGLARGVFDLVHARFVCQEAGVGPLLDEMIALAKPGGIVALEEPGPEIWEIEPTPAGYPAVAKRVAAAFLRRRAGTGPALAEQMRRRGLVGIECRQHRLRFRGGHPYAAMPAFALAATRGALLETGALTRRELGRLAARLDAASRDRTVRHQTFPVWQVTGRRRGVRRPAETDSRARE
jgi:SAM-dependent methyltransferase